MLALSGPGGNGYYGQTVEDMKSYYQYLTANCPMRSSRPPYSRRIFSRPQQCARAPGERRQQRRDDRYCRDAGRRLGRRKLRAGDLDRVCAGKRTGRANRCGVDSAFSVEDGRTGPVFEGFQFVQMWDQSGVLFPILFSSLILAIAAAAYLLMATGHRAAEEEGASIHLRFFDRWPVVLLGVLLAAAFIVCMLIWEAFAWRYRFTPLDTVSEAAEYVSGLPFYDADFLLTLAALLIWLFALVCCFHLAHGGRARQGALLLAHHAGLLYPAPDRPVCQASDRAAQGAPRTENGAVD